MRSLFRHRPEQPPEPTIEAIWREHLGFIRAWVRRLRVGRQDRDDVTSEVIEATMKALPRYDRIRPLRGWLYQIIFLQVKVYKRRMRKEAQRRAEDFEPAWVVDPAPTSEEGMIDDETETEASRLVDRLLQEIKPEKRRLVFIAFELQGMTIAEICDAFSIPANTARSMIRRARAQFEAAYNRYEAEQRRRGALVIPFGAAALLARERDAGFFVPDDVRARLWKRVGHLIEKERAPRMPAAQSGRPLRLANPLRLPPLPPGVGPFLAGTGTGAAIVLAFLHLASPPAARPELEIHAPVDVAPGVVVIEPIPPVPTSFVVPAFAAHAPPAVAAPPAASTLPDVSPPPAGNRSRAMALPPDDAVRDASLVRLALDAFDRGDFGAARGYVEHHSQEFPNSKFAFLRENIRAKLPR